MNNEELENFPTSESAQRMLSYVSNGFYDKSYVGKWLFQVIGLEYDDARKLVEELPRQMFPETATWGLKYHEIKWGLPVRENLSYEERRQRIYCKRDYKAPMTPYSMESYLKNITKFQVHIADCNDPGPFNYIPKHPNMFKVFVIGEGTLNTKAVKNAINKLKQSHTLYVLNDHVDYKIDNSVIEEFELYRLLIVVKVLKQIYNRFPKILLETSINNFEHITNTRVICRKNLVYLDGTVLLDGSRLMNAAITQEEL